MLRLNPTSIKTISALSNHPSKDRRWGRTVEEIREGTGRIAQYRNESDIYSSIPIQRKNFRQAADLSPLQAAPPHEKRGVTRLADHPPIGLGSNFLN